MSTTETDLEAGPTGAETATAGAAGAPADAGAPAAAGAPARTDAGAPAAGAGSSPPEDEVGVLVEEELLVEEISIDGMCGVY